MPVCALMPMSRSRMADCLPRLVRPVEGFDLVFGLNTRDDEALALSLVPALSGFRRVILSEVAPWANLYGPHSLNLRQLLMLRWAHFRGEWDLAVTVEEDVRFVPCPDLEEELLKKLEAETVWGVDIDGRGQYVTGSCQGLFGPKRLERLWDLFKQCKVGTHNADVQLWVLEDVPEFLEAIGMPSLQAGAERLNWWTFPHVAYGMFQILCRGWGLFVANRGRVELPHYDFTIYGLEYKDRWVLSQMPRSFWPMQVMDKYHEDCPEMSSVWVINHLDRG